MQNGQCSLSNSRVSAVLDRLHREAQKDGRRFAKLGLSSLAGVLAARGLAFDDVGEERLYVGHDVGSRVQRLVPRGDVARPPLRRRERPT